MDLGAVLIAVAGVTGTLGGSLLTQRAAERGRRRELELVRDQEASRELLALRRACYGELNRDARQFTTALGTYLFVLRAGAPTDADRAALEAAKAAHRDRYSEAQMIAPHSVLAPAAAANRALNDVYGRLKRIERGEPAGGEDLGTAEEAREAVWPLLRTLRTALRADLGINDPF
ncbi:hypothetical protein [Streptomyces sp. NPDC089919]|uniref:hypothetical protein n=1 Tax=Streptomyces sp. NPDC089919 TaxID=3155188 RepID=UPI003414951D